MRFLAAQKWMRAMHDAASLAKQKGPAGCRAFSFDW
jgi:hypothetical protein